MAESDLGRFDATGSVSFYMDIASNGFAFAGTEQLDGVKALRYDGAISGEQLNEAMALTGADEMLSAATDVQGATFEGSMPAGKRSPKKGAAGFSGRKDFYRKPIRDISFPP